MRQIHKYHFSGNHSIIITLNRETTIETKINAMQFLLTAYDGTDGEAPGRRLSARPEHLGKIREFKKSGEFLFGGAILDNNGNMIGSMILYEFPDRKTMDERLKDEPYIYAGVWKRIEIVPFRLAQIE
jgi:uncharacterized protein YciI